jgi:hypothetical protein
VNLIREMPQLHVKPLSKTTGAQDLDEQKQQGNIQHKVDDHSCDALRYVLGPLFVAGLGRSDLTDIYGEFYGGSESQDFFTTLAGSDTSIRLDQELILGRDL